MKHKSFLKLCSGNKFAATLFGILVITIVSSLYFVQSVFGQNSIQQIFETFQAPKMFAAASGTVVVTEAETSMAPAAPTAEPAAPTAEITEIPTETPTAIPTATPTAEPTATPTDKPIAEPTAKPTPKPAAKPAQAAPAATTAAATAPPACGSFDCGMSSAVLDLANQQRTGLCAMSWSDSLAATAQIRAKEIAVSFSHTRPDGSAWYTAGSQLAENIAKGQSSSDSVMQSWMASAGHAANILNPAYTQIGVACYCVDGTYYWVQEFS